MSQTRNDNLEIRAPKHIDTRTNNNGVPFQSVEEANALIIYRVQGLTVQVLKDGVTTDFWYRDGVENDNLIEKSFNSAGGLMAELIANIGAEHVGGVNTGDTFIEGTPFEDVLRKILIRSIPAIYTAPGDILSTSLGTFIQESGTIISPMFTNNFQQNDAGVLQSISLRKNGTEISNSVPFTDINYQFTDSTANYSLIAYYAQGAVKNNNLGIPSPAGRIEAGNITSNTIAYSGKRKMFGGTQSSGVSTSASIRSLAHSLLNPTSGSTLTIDIAQNSTTVVFAYPATLPDVSTVQYVELSFAEVKPLFTKTLVNVEGANGYASIQYKVYTFTALQPFQTAVHYKVII